MHRQRTGAPFPSPGTACPAAAPSKSPAQISFHTWVPLACCSPFDLMLRWGQNNSLQNWHSTKISCGHRASSPGKKISLQWQTSCTLRAMQRAVSHGSIPIAFSGGLGVLHDGILYIYTYLWPYIVSFPASFSLTVCFDLTPCKQDIISQENREDHNLNMLIFMKQTKGIYFSSFFSPRVSKCTLTYSSSAVRKSLSIREEQSQLTAPL